ncbi:MAG: NUDIX domain-containing protein [Prevotellaceae bacterium]|jgi:8-oxo-dGTP pyrophosphatase MutT (NUDIX family)|nr:NUDIX domain-containing protein [Prevotellaceae bacterium]
MIKIVHAAGGLVQNSFGEYLLIYKNGRWDLPKGQQDNGEALSVTALREVSEECGIMGIRLGRWITNTVHSYRLDMDLIFKRTHWYRMFVDGKPIPSPQTEEGIEKCCWCSLEEAAALLDESYPSIRRVFRLAMLNHRG